MLKPLYSGLIQALTLVEDVIKLKSGEKETRQEIKELAQLARDWRHEQLRDREIAAHERENLVLRLENALLRSERNLPALEVKDETDGLRERIAALEETNEELRRRIEALERRK